MAVRLGAAMALVAVLSAAPGLAQPLPPNGPPIPLDQVFRSQPKAPPPMPPSLPAPPPLTSRSMNDYRALPPATPGVDVSRDRVVQCQHEAVARGIRKSKRGAYVHNCAYAR